MNEIEKTIETLELFNRWRRDDEGEFECPGIKEIGIAIDEACDQLKQIKDKPTKIYELVDNTGDVYYCLGLYLTFEEALEQATGGNEPCCEGEECINLEIRERNLGFSGWGEHGKLKAEICWQEVYNEQEDDYSWGVPEVTIKGVK